MKDPLITGFHVIEHKPDQTLQDEVRKFLYSQPEYKNVDVTNEKSMFYHVAPIRVINLMTRFAEYYASACLKEKEENRLTETERAYAEIGNTWIDLMEQGYGQDLNILTAFKKLQNRFHSGNFTPPPMKDR